MKLINTILASALMTGASLASAEVEWVEPRSADLRAASLETNPRAVPASMHTESAAINFTWAPDESQSLRPSAGEPTPGDGNAAVESRQYWVDVTGRDLAEGIELPLTAPGAVIRISALDDSAGVRLDSRALELTLDGRPTSAEMGIAEVRSGRELRSQGMSVPEDTLAFRLTGRHGGGTLGLKLPGVAGDQAMVVHVYEPNSDWVARLSAPRHNFLSGQALNLETELGNARQNLQADSVQAILVSPDATQTWPISQARGGGLVLNEAPIATNAEPGQGLYEAHVYLETDFEGLTIRRDLKLALNIAPALARLDGQARRVESRDFGLELGVESAIGGRFQINAELMGTNRRGELESIGFVQSADVIEAGGGQISLEFDRELMRKSGLSAPFEVHNLQLLDQGRMFLLEDRERALIIR